MLFSACTVIDIQPALVSLLGYYNPLTLGIQSLLFLVQPHVHLLAFRGDCLSLCILPCRGHLRCVRQALTRCSVVLNTFA